MTDLSETLVQQHLLRVGRDQPEVGPSNLQQHRPVPGLVTAAGGGGITVILRLAGTDWKYRKCYNRLKMSSSTIKLLTSWWVIKGVTRGRLQTGDVGAPAAQHVFLLLLLLELLKSFVNKCGRGSLVTRLDLSQTENLVELGEVRRGVSAQRGRPCELLRNCRELVVGSSFGS